MPILEEFDTKFKAMKIVEDKITELIATLIKRILTLISKEYETWWYEDAHAGGMGHLKNALYNFDEYSVETKECFAVIKVFVEVDGDNYSNRIFWSLPAKWIEQTPTDKELTTWYVK